MTNFSSKYILESENEVLNISEEYYSLIEDKIDSKVPNFEDEILISSPKKYYLYCEGKTEKKYFNSLMKNYNPTTRIEIITFIPNAGDKEGTNARKLVKQFVSKKNGIKFDKDYDIFFMIFDRDNNHIEPNVKDNNLNYAILKCKENDFIPIFSNPYFEVWKICEYKKLEISDFPFKAKEVKKLFNSIKRGQTIEFKDKINNGVKNAKKLYRDKAKKGIKIHSEKSFPLTEVFLLVIELEKEFM